LALDFFAQGSGTDCAQHTGAPHAILAPLAGSTQYKARDCLGHQRVEIIMKQPHVSGHKYAERKLSASESNRHRPRSKKEQLVTLLSKPNGARISSLCKRLGWQKHTVRAAISGLRASGIAIETSASSKDGMTVYKITDKPSLKATV